MFISLAYLFTKFIVWLNERFEIMQYVRIVGQHARQSSVILHRMKSSLSEGMIKLTGFSSPLVYFIDENEKNGIKSRDSDFTVIYNTNNCEIIAAHRKLIFSSKSLFGTDTNVKPSLFSTMDNTNKLYLLLQLVKQNPDNSVVESMDQLHIGQEKKLENFVRVISARKDFPTEIIAECSNIEFVQFIRCFVEGTLVTDNNMMVVSAASFILDDNPVSQLLSTGSPLLAKYPHSGSGGESGDTSVFGNNSSPFHKIKSLQREDSSVSFNSDCAGEVPAASLAELAPELLTPVARRSALCGKPPNILIYCGKKDSNRLFEGVRSVISKCVNPNRYTIYHLKHDHVKTMPWIENTVLLIISSDKVYDGVDDVFRNYFIGGGTIVSFASAFDKLFLKRNQTNSKPSVLNLSYRNWNNVTVICGLGVYDIEMRSLMDEVSILPVATEKQSSYSVIVEAVHDSSGGVALLSQASLEKDPSEMAISTEIFTSLKQSNTARFEILSSLFAQLGLDCERPPPPALTPVFLLANDPSKRRMFLDSIGHRLIDGLLTSKEVCLKFLTLNDFKSHPSSPINASRIPVVTDHSGDVASKFDFSVYKRNLQTNVLGNVVLAVDVVTTTMSLFESLMFSVPPEIGLIAIAQSQTGGQGRGGNAWLSPDGCAIFSLHVRIPVRSRLGEHISCLQHLVSLSVILAVRQKPGYQSIDVRIKWPNDIYFGSSMKLGGILIKSSILQDLIHANIGCGVNVANKDPTICINDLVLRANETGSSDDAAPLELFSTEELIARTVSELEKLIEDFQMDGGNSFRNLYHRYWLHSDQMVTLNSSEGPGGRVVGLDEYGYLSVALSDGGTVTVQPDGNSFDMMRNLIAPKIA